MTSAHESADALLDLPLTDIADAVRGQKHSAVAVTEAAIARIDAHAGALNCFIRLEPDAARTQAKAVDAMIAAGRDPGLLAGVPMAHKDMFYRQGKISSFGSKIHRDVTSNVTATVLQRLDNAGAIDLGALNMSEFAVGPIGHNAHFGHCRNPWNKAHAAGGSSSGSGAATARRLIAGALGSDTGGSVRIPASFCGLTGLKPTNGRISRHGAMPLSFSFDCIGPLTRTAADSARLLAVLAGPDSQDPTASDRPVADYEAELATEPAGLRLGIAENYYGDGLTPEIENALVSAIRSFEALDLNIVKIQVPDHPEINSLWTVVMSSEGAAVHQQWLCERPDDYHEQVRRRLEIGLYQPASAYIRALSLRGTILNRFLDKVFGNCDALLLPTTPVPAPNLEDADIGAGDALPAFIQNMTGFTRPINFLGLPSVSVPCGFSEEGLPLAFQLVGRPFAEARILQLAHAYQSVTDWHEAAPV